MLCLGPGRGTSLKTVCCTCTHSTFSKSLNGVSCHEWWKYLRACICAQGRKFEIYFRLCTVWGSPIFSVDKVDRFDIWLTKWDSSMTIKLIKFDLFCFKLFPQVVQKHQLGEVRNSTTPSSCIFSGIFLPKIIKIEYSLTKLYGWWKTGIFLTHGVYIYINCDGFKT